jgi:hypothetical protein
MFSSCVAVPDNCALARRGVTATELEQSIWSLINTVKYHPIPMGSFLLDYTVPKAIIVRIIYSTYLWLSLTSFLDNLFQGNLSSVLTQLETYLASQTKT